MTGRLLARGMLSGILAGILVFAFARWTGEPQVERAIAIETQADQAKSEAPEPELVSRKVQKGLGLLTGVLVYSTAVGGLFALVFSYSYGRVGIAHPRALSALLAGIGFVTIVVIPGLKYPANPPSVGNPETIGIRTAAFFLLIASSIGAMVLAVQLRRRFTARFGAWNAFLLASGLFLVMVTIICRLFPTIDEVPLAFPAQLLWKFRIAAVEIQAVMWTTLGLVFGWLAERELLSPRGRKTLGAQHS